MLPDRVSNPGPLIYESGALPIALRGPVKKAECSEKKDVFKLHLTLSNTIGVWREGAGGQAPSQ